MKSKPQEIDKKVNEKEPDFEVKNEGPSIASAKRNKFLIVSASVALVSFVVYFFFFNAEKPVDTNQQLESVEAPKKATFAKSEDGASPFEFKKPEQKATSEGLEFLDKPTTPDIPSVPELPENTSVIDDLILAPKDQKKGAQQQANQNTVNNPNTPSIPNTQNIQNPLDPNLLNQGQQDTLAPQAVNPTANNVNAVANKSKSLASDAKPKEEEPLNPRYSPIIVFTGGQGTNMSAVGYENNIINLKMDDVDQLKSLEDKTKINILADRSHTIAQGKFLSAVIETSITTEMPGPIRGIIDRDVYGESGKEVLLPRGTRIFGSYSASVKRGQGRVEINWSRLLRQDGVSLGISFVGSDQFGRAGIQGEVDNKYSSVIANSLLTSVLAVGSLAATQGVLGNNSSTTTVSPTLGTTTTTGNAANQALYDVTKNVINIVSQILRNSIDLNPIIRIPQGTRVTVVVNSDMRIPSMKKTRSGGQ